MAGKAKFDQEAALKSILGADRQVAPEQEAAGRYLYMGLRNRALE